MLDFMWFDLFLRMTGFVSAEDKRKGARTIWGVTRRHRQSTPVGRASRRDGQTAFARNTFYFEHPMADEQPEELCYQNGSRNHPRRQQKTGNNNMRTRKQIGAGLLTLVIGLALAMPGCTEGEKEVTLKFADCPAAVQKTMIDHANGVQFTEVDKETGKDGRVVYEAEGKTADGKKIEIKVAADGKLVGFEIGDDK
ncbi:MAG: hypothetical protein Q8J74_12140 [Candidatus Didemnitutus sp.]|nr:hypothetical protein [Candidatus Didemnitutus sp.]